MTYMELVLPIFILPIVLGMCRFILPIVFALQRKMMGMVGTNDRNRKQTVPYCPELPLELLEKVFVKLPFGDLMRARVVCRNWRFIIHSPLFARLYPIDHDQHTVYFYYRRGDMGIEGGRSDAYLAIPNVRTGSWEKHYLPFDTPWRVDVEDDALRIVASDYGLLCFRSDNVNYLNTIFIYNPLIRTWRKLTVKEDYMKIPADSVDPPRMLVGIFVNQETGSYKLVCSWLTESEDLNEDRLGYHSAPSRILNSSGVKVGQQTFGYNSTTDTWELTRAVLPQVVGKRFELSPWEGVRREWRVGTAFRCNRSLYWCLLEVLINGQRQEWTMRTVVRVYEADLDLWSVAENCLPHYIQLVPQDHVIRMLNVWDVISNNHLEGRRVILDEDGAPFFPALEGQDWENYVQVLNLDRNKVDVEEDADSDEDEDDDDANRGGMFNDRHPDEWEEEHNGHQAFFQDFGPEFQPLEDSFMKRRFGRAPEGFTFVKAIAYKNMWYIAFRHKTSRLPSTPVLVLAVDQNEQDWTWLPPLFPTCTRGIGTFIATLDTFVATWRAVP